MVDISRWELVITVWVSLWLMWQTLRICWGNEILSKLLVHFYASRDRFFFHRKYRPYRQLLHYDYFFLLQTNCKSSFFSFNYKPSIINISINISNIKLRATFHYRNFSAEFHIWRKRYSFEFILELNDMTKMSSHDSCLFSACTWRLSHCKAHFTDKWK